VGRPYYLYPKANARLPVVKNEGFFQTDYSPIYSIVTLLYGTLQSTLGYDTLIRRTCMMAANSNFAFKNATKSLQIETQLLLTAFRNSPWPNLTVSSRTPYPYDVHELKTDDRPTTAYSKLHYGRPMISYTDSPNYNLYLYTNHQQIHINRAKQLCSDRPHHFFQPWHRLGVRQATGRNDGSGKRYTSKKNQTSR